MSRSARLGLSTSLMVALAGCGVVDALKAEDQERRDRLAAEDEVVEEEPTLTELQGQWASPERATEFLTAHNLARANVSPAADPEISALVWDDGLAEIAKGYAEECIFAHSTMDWGENLFVSTANRSATHIVDAWVSEVADYDYDTNSCVPNKLCGHYTQVVSRRSTKVGCATVFCEDVSNIGSGYLTVCEYDPSGNIIGFKPY